MSDETPKKNIILEHGEKFFGYYPQLLIVVGVRYCGKVNFIPVAWKTCLSYTPFLYGVSIGKNRFTHSLMQQSSSFSVNFLNYEHTHLVRSLGRSSGAEIDKEKEFNINFTTGEKTDAPIMTLAYCTFECLKQEAVLFGDHTLFVGKVVTIEIKENVMKEDKTLNTDIVSPILYLGIDNFITIDNKSFLSLKKLPLHYKVKKKR